MSERKRHCGYALAWCPPSQRRQRRMRRLWLIAAGVVLVLCGSCFIYSDQVLRRGEQIITNQVSDWLTRQEAATERNQRSAQ